MNLHLIFNNKNTFVNLLNNRYGCLISMQSAQGLLEIQFINRFGGLWKKKCGCIQKKRWKSIHLSGFRWNQMQIAFFRIFFLFLILIGFDDDFLVRLDFVWIKTIFAFEKQKKCSWWTHRLKNAYRNFYLTLSISLWIYYSDDRK